MKRIIGPPTFAVLFIAATTASLWAQQSTPLPDQQATPSSEEQTTPSPETQISPSLEQRTLDAILKELQDLRQTMERSMAVNSRIQLIIERIGLQEQRVMAAARALDQVQLELAQEKQTRAESRVRAQDLQKQWETTGGTAQRRELAKQRDEAQARADNDLIQQSIQQRVDAAAAQLKTEEDRLTSVRERMDALSKAVDQLDK